MLRPLQTVRRRILDRLVLRPSREPIDPGNQQRVLLQSGSRGESLECFVQTQGDPRAPLDLLVVKFPGTAGRGERTTSFPFEFLPSRHAEIWSWNPPGYGQSTGRAGLERIAEAAMEYWRHVTQQRGDTQTLISASTRILICGNSLGCATALRVAASLPQDDARLGILLRNPPPLGDVVKHVAKRYPMGKFVFPIADSLPDMMNAIATASQVKLPVVFMQSELDTLVLPELQQKVIDDYAGPKRIVLLHGLTHGCAATEQHEPSISESLMWLWEQTTV